MEYASGGDLTQKIKQQQGKPFKEDLLWNFLIQISQGLKYLHDKRILVSVFGFLHDKQNVTTNLIKSIITAS